MKNNKLFFCCVIDGVYKEFSINITKEVKETLKREEFYQNKYASAFSKEEQQLIASKKKISAMLKGFESNQKTCLNLQNIKSYKDSMFTYVIELLSETELQETFSLPVSKMNSYFKGMLELVKLIPELQEEFQSNQEYYETAKENTMLLSDMGAVMKPIMSEDNEFMGYKMDLTQYVEQTRHELKTSSHVLVKKNKKIS